MQDGVNLPKRVRKSTTERNEDTGTSRGKASGSAKQALIYIPPVIETARILPSVALSLYDKATQLVLSEDQLVCYGCEGGYRMVRATQGVHSGSYLWEAEILPAGGENAHTRIGWSTRLGELQAPTGYDQHSFAYRDLNGSRVNNSIRIDDYGESYTVGDVIGCMITLDMDPLQNRISFFKNGKYQGIAYSGEEVPSGIFFPSISLYNKAIVAVNFGPSYIEKYDVQGGVHSISELQPMNPEDRQKHDKVIAEKRREHQSRNSLVESTTMQS